MQLSFCEEDLARNATYLNNVPRVRDFHAAADYGVVRDTSVVHQGMMLKVQDKSGRLDMSTFWCLYRLCEYGDY